MVQAIRRLSSACGIGPRMNQNQTLLQSAKSAPKIFTPPNPKPNPIATGSLLASSSVVGARLPAFPRPSFPPSTSISSFSSSPSTASSSFLSTLIPRFPSSRLFHTAHKMSNEIVHPTIQGLLQHLVHHLSAIPRPTVEIFIQTAPPWS